ncbi:hypothetical protein [Sedimenticola hydrogenitrophicus]|uniref:hypothetical protein n=1 Tax=Sedimenticola hydrogenitrophicus TaxID=2967975 RepID=UPI0021A3C477|nr:hypothetical protein [Sedimenticola hydrogenitrophicus]
MKKKVLIVIVWLLSLVIVAEISARSAMKNQLSEFSIELRRVQAMNSVNHLERYREFHDYLTHGCNTEALEKAEIAANREMHVIASLVERDTTGSISEYIVKRDPAILAEMKGLKAKPNASWEEPKCMNL